MNGKITEMNASSRFIACTYYPCNHGDATRSLERHWTQVLMCNSLLENWYHTLEFNINLAS